MHLLINELECCFSVMYDLRNIVFEFDYVQGEIDIAGNTEFSYIVEYVKKTLQKNFHPMVVLYNLLWKLTTQVIRDEYDKNNSLTLIQILAKHNFAHYFDVMGALNHLKQENNIADYCDSQFGAKFFNELCILYNIA